ncbi:sensor histidine kinase [Clostridium thailandense]|uniref:sensor histidine kinase n=1 Tax=Clostridium thailandense TaxID=2794346 RepID=UPI0039898DD6
MFNIVMKILYILLFMIPLSILRYYPFLDKLRISLRNVIIIYTFLITLEAGVFSYITNNGSINGMEIQVYRIAWGGIFALYSFIVIKDKFFKQFFFYLIVASYSAVIFGTANFLEANIFQEVSEKHPYTITNVAVIVQIIFTFPAMFELILKRLKKFADSVETDIWKFIWLIPFMFYSMGLIFTTDLSTAESWKHIVTRYMIGIGAFTACYILLKTLKQLSDNANLKERLYFIDQQLQMQKKQYKAIAENIEKTRKARHDLRHHLILVRRYIEADKKAELLKYLEEQHQSIPVDVEKTICENTAVNVLVCYYIGLAKEKGIRTDFKISIPTDIGILDSDLSIIFGNCIENALEACERMKSGEKFIRVRAGMKMGELVIVIGNGFDGHVLYDNEQFFSIKRNGNRGIGISSVRAVAEKYGGNSEFKVVDEKNFKVSMVLRTKV